MSDPGVLDSILKIWGPITLLVGAIAMGAQASVRLGVAERRVEQIDSEIKEMKKESKVDFEGTRSALGRIQRNQAAICQKLDAECKY